VLLLVQSINQSINQSIPFLLFFFLSFPKKKFSEAFALGNATFPYMAALEYACVPACGYSTVRAWVAACLLG